jgi:hypothetical protein
LKFWIFDVGFDVAVDVGSPIKLLSTNIAFKTQLLLLDSVSFLMSPQKTAQFKRLITQIAFKSCVSNRVQQLLMGIQSALVIESLSAVKTLVQFQIPMNRFMFIQLVFEFE